MRGIAAAALFVAVMGCATSGTKITQSKLDQLEQGKTVYQEAVQLLGRHMAETRMSDGNRIISWSYSRVGFAGIGGVETQGVSVIFGPDGKMKGYTKYESGAPSPTVGQ